MNTKIIARDTATGLYFNGISFTGKDPVLDGLALRPGTTAQDFALLWNADKIEIVTVGDNPEELRQKRMIGLLHGGTLTPAQQSAATAILAYLKANPGFHALRWIVNSAGLLGTKRGDFWKALNAMRNAGIVETLHRKRSRTAKRGGYGSTEKWNEYGIAK